MMTVYDEQPAGPGRFRCWLAMVWHRIRTFFRSSGRLDLPPAFAEPPVTDERETTIEFYRSLLEEPVRGVAWWYSQNEARTTELPQVADVFVQVRAVLSAPPGGSGEEAERSSDAGWDALYAEFTDHEVDGANAWATLMASMFEQKGYFDLALKARQLGRPDADGSAYLNGHPAPVPDQASPLE